MVEFGIDERDVVGCAAPLFHNAGLYCWFQMAVGLGCTSVLMPTWNPATVPQTCRDEAVTSLFAVPTQLNGLLLHKHFDPAMLASVKKINFAGARMPAQQFERLRETLPEADLIEHYGQSEFGIISVRRHWRNADKAATVGRRRLSTSRSPSRPQRQHAASRRDRRGGGARRRGHDRLCRRPGETARYMRFDGWLYTGDIGPDSIRRAISRWSTVPRHHHHCGENIASAEVELASTHTRRSRNAPVSAIPEEHWGEVPARRMSW